MKIRTLFAAIVLLAGACVEGVAGTSIYPIQQQMFFEANHGQADASAPFLARGGGYSLSLTAGEAALALQRAAVESGSATARAMLRMRLVGANTEAKMTGLDEQKAVVNYFVGSDPKQWHTKIPTFARVKAEGVYPGVDAVYYGNGRQLEFDFVVAPGADARRIEVAFDGADKMEIAANGDLMLHVGGAVLRQRKPAIYQMADGSRRNIEGGYKLQKSKVKFELAAYDRTKELVIDPTLTYSTYLGGAFGDSANDIAVDSSGNFYVAGFTISSNFPTANALQPTNALTVNPIDVAGTDAFVAKFRPDGTLVYATYLGGVDIYGDRANGIAVDAVGNAYVTGSAGSRNFPTTPGAYQTSFGPSGHTHAFVTKISIDGATLIYSTYLGGSVPATGCTCCGANDSSSAIAVDGNGNAYVCGWTDSGDFPTTANALQRVNGGCGGGNQSGDAFVTKLNATGTALVYSTLLGGEGNEAPCGIGVDSAGNAYVAGITGSINFPTTSNAFQKAANFSASDLDNVGTPSSSDYFVSKLNADGSALIYSTYLGGTRGEGYRGLVSEGGHGLAVDSSGNAYLVGTSASPDFPTVNALEPTFLTDVDQAFVSKLSADGSTLIYSTFIGCTAFTYGNAIALDSANNVYVAGMVRGYTQSGFPIVNSIPGQTGGGSQTVPFLATVPFVAKLLADGSRLAYSTFLSGTISDQANGVAVDARGAAYVAGYTRSSDFPVTANALQLNSADLQNSESLGYGAGDAFVSVIQSQNEPPAPAPTIVCPANIAVSAASGQTSTVVNFSVSATSPNSQCIYVTCTPPSGSAFPVGTSTVQCTAKDAVGATASCSFTVTVNCTLRFNGFLSPIDGADGTGGSFDSPLQTFKLNSTIPIKFTADCGGSPVLSGIHRLQVIQYTTQTTADSPIDATPTDAATTGDQFRLNDTQWQFNLDTKATGMTAGIWLLRATLSDGSQHTAWVQIK